MVRHTGGVVLLLAVALLPPPALASGLRVTPLRLDLSGAKTTTQVELTNLGATALPVQITVMSWRQDNAQDVYAPSKDVFFAPPIVSVPASGKAVVRFRLRSSPPTDGERAYRVYFQEVPPPQTDGSAGMAFRLKFGVPLFVAPARPVLPRLEIERELSGDALALTLANSGTAHVKIHGMEVFPADVDRQRPAGEPVARITHGETSTNYLLPGTRHRWKMSLPQGLAPERHVLLIRTDDYSGKGAPGMTAAGWLWLPLQVEVPLRDAHR